MRWALAWLLGVAGVAGSMVGCVCVPGGAGGGSASASASASGSLGAPGALSLGDLEKRAKKAGWRVTRSAENREGVYVDMDLELEGEDHFGYVSYFDYSPARKEAWHKLVVKNHAVLLVEVDEESGAPLVEAVTKAVVAGVDIEKVTRDELAKVLTAGGWKVLATTADGDVGLRWVTAEAETKDEATFNVIVHDYTEVAGDGRLANDELHWLMVHVCRDCTERERGLQGVENASLAKRLLARLASP
jgi:hypothetical protein